MQVKRIDVIVLKMGKENSLWNHHVNNVYGTELFNIHLQQMARSGQTKHTVSHVSCNFTFHIQYFKLSRSDLGQPVLSESFVQS